MYSEEHESFRSNMTHAETAWSIHSNLIHCDCHKMHSRENDERVGEHFVSIRVLEGKHFIPKYCDPAGRQCLNANSCSTGVEKWCRWSERSTVRGAKGVYQALPVLVSQIRSSLGLTDRVLLLRVAGYCVLLRLHSVWQRETTKKYRRHLTARNSTNKERNAVLAEQDVVRTEAGQGELLKKNVSFKKDPKYCDPVTKLLRLLVGGNPKSNNPCVQIAARKKCASPCAFLH